MYGKVCFFNSDHHLLSLTPLPISSVFLSSGLSSLLDRWDLPVAVFPFNIVIVLYLLCTGPDSPYFPHHQATPPGALEPNGTALIAEEVHRDPMMNEKACFKSNKGGGCYSRANSKLMIDV